MSRLGKEFRALKGKAILARILTLLPTLWLAVFLALPSELPLALVTLAALGVHELGHILAFSALGEPSPRFSIAPGGFRLSSEKPLSHLGEGAVAAAGPLANLLVGGLFLLLAALFGGASEYFTICALLQLSSGLWNLLPIGELDGARILSAILSPLPPDSAERVASALSHLTLLLSLAVALGVLHFSGACFYTSLALFLLLFTDL